jgi:hypothetical protein
VSRRVVEAEPGLDGDRTMGHVRVLGRGMERDLSAALPGLHFRVVPIWEPDGPEDAGAASGAGAVAGG